MNTKNLFVLGVIGMLLISCGKAQPPPLVSGSYQEDSSAIVSTPPHQKPPYTPVAKDPTIQYIESTWTYRTGEVCLPAYTRIAEMVSYFFQDWRACYQHSGVGGPKLIGEMSADKKGYNYSQYSRDLNFSLIGLEYLHLKFISSANNLICHIINRKCTIEDASIIASNGMCLLLNVYNSSNLPQHFVVESGQMVEADSDDVQNLVINRSIDQTIEPHSYARLQIPVFCASHYRSSPTGSTARITPYVLKADQGTLSEQRKVWSLIESDEDPNSYVTFYVWGKGDRTRSGQQSATGHAFIRIPLVGVWGFSSQHGLVLDDDGEITDHTRNLPYAVDSCRIKLSDQDMQALINKLNELRRNVPKYRIGRYDCTSFVMDLADAAKIRYGNRLLIQTPVGFMQELKKSNYID